jgi:hypothetical protein
VDFPPTFHEIPDNMLFRPTTAPRFEVSWHVIRLPNTGARTSQQFWSLAQAIAARPLVSWQHRLSTTAAHSLVRPC